jgi:tRNA(Ile2) C34 agmatinyltransferase TiaS
MKIILTEKQYNQLIERIEEDTVICDKCGWSWEISDGGDDTYVCHKCGNDNTPENKKG